MQQPSLNSQSIIIYSDGAARGNPGPAGIGVLLTNEQGQPLRKVSKYIGRATNNEAEYQAVIAGLEAATQFQPESLHLYLDSELVVKQLSGQYRVKSENLIPLHKKARDLLRRFKAPAVSHVKRGANREADALANKAIDDAQTSRTA